MTEQELRGMKLHDVITTGTNDNLRMDIMRVIGGWLYIVTKFDGVNFTGKRHVTTTFVPYCDKFKNKQNE